jgi:DNA-binding NtrC family response regulator
LKELCKSFERQIILKTLEEMEWNRTKTARVLKIHRNTLNLKLQDMDRSFLR